MHLQILFVRACCSVLDQSDCIIVVEFIVSEVYHCQGKGKHVDNDEVESEEGLQVLDHLAHHGHQESQVLKDSQEKEGLYQHDIRVQHHHSHGSRVSDVNNESLTKEHGNSSPNVALVDVVPRVLEVIEESGLVNLKEIVESWINNANQQQDLPDNPPIKFPVHVYFIDVYGEDYKVDAVNESAEEVQVLSVGIPLELEEVFHYVRVED